jgi:predicted amidohydrolase YtcJ
MQPDAPDVILHSGLFTTLDRSNPTAGAVAVKNGVFTAVGQTEEILPLADRSTRTIDLQGYRVLPKYREASVAARAGCGRER